MATIKARRGLDLPIHGAPSDATVVDRLDVNRVALLPQEVLGAKVRLLAQEGDTVQVGTALMCDRRDEAALFTSPAAGKISAIHRGKRRAVLSIVIEATGYDDAVPFTPLDLSKTSRDDLKQALLGSGLWPSIRRRPFDRVAISTDEPAAIIVQAYDSSPLAPELTEVVAGRDADIVVGLTALKKLTDGMVHVAVKDGVRWGRFLMDGVHVHQFRGPHPAGTAGFSIHSLCPAGANRTVWHVGVQDVADIGRLLRDGKRPTERIVSLGGPAARSPKIVRTRPGAELEQLCLGEVEANQPRFVNGSAIWGNTASIEDHTAFVGRWNTQVTLLEDGVTRDLIGWALPISGRFTQTNTVWDKFFRKSFKYDTDTNGSLRAIVPIGQYESVMPMDVLATQLIKALAAKDLEAAEKLGVLELSEEDLALCQVVDPSKVPITDWLRDMLTTIEKEG
ncbi:MAG: NADH:ubiquinone reductase (Na(+)-transporting) subunit A [Planctomycetota bacterium]|nr:NADH:ubiquinone reductase (Na(+)-transporting) subunit A [Planctomycetota bacterium]MDG1985755.1 NADH:ubiquinone reductase (Na(+)-transporting) subunit A [Planctomycetota bacterium]